MKKILSLLALLVMTLTAFATDYTGHRTVIFGVNTPTESDDAVLTITDNGDNTFNVTFKDFINVDGTYTDNYGTYTFSNVAGTTENGVTTIDLSNLSVSVENCDFLYTEASDGRLFAKFNAEKAYARFSAAIGSIFRKSTISAEFGVDDFESTGGGEPGGEDKPAIVDVVEEGFKATGESWKKEGVAIDWDTQYIAAKLDLSTCKTSSGPENVLAVGTDITGWNDGPHYLFYYNKAAKVLQYNYLHSANKSYNRGFANLSKAYFQGINYAVKALRYTKDEEEKLYMTLIPTYGTTLAFGTDPDYVAPEPPSIEGTVVEGSVDFAANGSKFEWSNIAIDWNKQKLVAVIDLSTCVGTNEDILSVGQNISAWQIGGWHFYYTKSDNRMKSDYLTTGGAHPISDANTPVEPGIVRIELSKAEGCTIDGVSFNGFYDSSVTGTWQSNTADFWALTSVNIGSKEGNGRSNAVIKYVTVVDIESTEPETPKAVVYKNTLKIVRGTDTKEYTDAEVSVLAKGEGKYEVVLPEFSDMDSAEGTIPGTIGKLTFVADGVEADGKLKLTASSVETTQEGGEGWESQTFTASMDATVENDQLAGTFTVVVDGYETMYTYNLYYGVEAPEVVTEVSNDNYTSNLRILDGETTVVEEAEANVNIVKYSDESYKVTLKDVTLNENTQDLVFVGTTPEEAPTAEAAEPLTIIAKSDEATTAFFGEEMNGTFEITEVSDDEIKMEFTIEGEGVLYEGEFNYEAKTPATEPFCKENYVADGNGFEWEIPVDWDTQKIVMSIDPSTCTGNCEDVIGLGAVPTAWVNTLHLYRTRDQKLQGYFQVPGGNNNNTDKFAETVPFLVEVSKAQGFVVNDEVKIAASEMSYLFTLPTVKMGTGEGANDKSRATYNYVKVVDKDWTKDPETGINATTVAEGEFEVFSVDGVKLAKLQKGLNIVRSADGKVKKVLVK